VLETAARLICEKGYEAASVQDIADACGLTKAGLYYYIRSKEDRLLEIQNYGMDIFEERVLLPVLNIADPVERLKACMEKNIHLVTEGWSKEVTIILHEHGTLTGAARAQINVVFHEVPSGTVSPFVGLRRLSPETPDTAGCKRGGRHHRHGALRGQVNHSRQRPSAGQG